MPEDLGLFCLADPLNFAHPADWSPSWNVDLTLPTLASGWSIARTSFWVIQRPPAAALIDRPLAGWKVHVSAIEETAIKVLEEVTKVCVREEVGFKHLRSTALVVAMNSKAAPRNASGKFVTIYPCDDAQTERIAETLSVALRGVAGPRVLTDVPWNDDAPVSVRHGAFASRSMWLADGRQVTALTQADGTLTPDRREIPHRAPDIDIPNAIRSRFEKRLVSFPFRVSAAIQFSNCGGVYRANAVSDRDEALSALVLKEARPHTGSGPSLVSATERLSNEARWLRHLVRVDGVPLLRHELVADGHRFIAVDEVEGVNLRSWVAAHHPSLQPGASSHERDEYVGRCRKIMGAIRALVGLIHEEGVAHRDLHPGNVMVDDSLTVSIIDFELATWVSDESTPTLGCPGFGIEVGTAAERDLHAVDVIELWMLSPVIGGAIEFDVRLLDRHLEDAWSVFGLPASSALEISAVVRSRVRRRIRPVPPGDEYDDVPRRLADWLASSASLTSTPIFPLDPRGMSTPLTELGLAHGASGIVTALQASRGGESVHEIASEVRGRAFDVIEDDPGLWDGWAGVAATAALRGDEDLASFAEQRSLRAAEACTSLDLARGLSGVASMLLTRADLEPLDSDRRRDQALMLSWRICDALDGPAAPKASGLEDGYSGIALVLARAAIHADGAERRNLVDAVMSCRERDLASCERLQPGVLVVRRGALMLPYLGRGALGVALARARTAAVVGAPAIDEPVRALANSALIDLVVDAGPIAGRSGLALALFALSEITGNPDAEMHAREWARWATRHVDRLDRNLIRTDRGVSALGRGGARLSGDLATGTAGVLCVAEAYSARLASEHTLLLDALVGGALIDPDPPDNAGQYRRTAATTPNERATKQAVHRSPSGGEYYADH